MAVDQPEPTPKPDGPKHDGLSWGYRFGYRLRYTLLHIFGPAQLSGSQNPHNRLKRERERKIEAARARRDARGR